ncbi:hypothetical protein [Amycolatopsis sp. CA-128772]|uniref:hypothetical protein n=1 Tax=Amycolatopsis sp. CA-128772 TaxID=2073159 RepID=UPI0011B02ADE|nr:hypothetical protein [Amycolatopsis sp. CA-128772]
MTPSPPATASALLSHWRDLSVRAEHRGPLAVATESTHTGVEFRPGVRLMGDGRVVAVLDGRDLVDLLVEGPRALRTLIDALSAEWNTHSPMGDWCRECARPVPCPTRTRLAGILAAGSGGVA